MTILYPNMDDSDNSTSSPIEGSNYATSGEFDPAMTFTVPYLPDGLFFHPHWRQYREMLENVPDAVHYALAIYITFVGCAGIIGNACVIYIFIVTKSLRTPSNMFIVNLAISDLGFSAVNGFPLMTISSFMRKWYFGKVACDLYGVFSGIFGLTSINTLAFISFDRFYVIQFPLRAMRTVTHRRSAIQIVFIWLWATIWSTPPLLGWGRYIPEGLQTSCGFDFLSQDISNQAFNYCLFSCGFVLPVCFAVCSYAGIICAVSAQAKHMGKIKQTKGSSRTDKEKKQEIRLAKIAAVTIGLFVISWLPYASLVIISTSGQRWMMSPYVCQIPSVFAKASAIWNPFVYSISHPRYRLALQEQFPWLLCKRREDETSHIADAATRRPSVESENVSVISSESETAPETRSPTLTSVPKTSSADVNTTTPCKIQRSPEISEKSKVEYKDVSRYTLQEVLELRDKKCHSADDITIALQSISRMEAPEPNVLVSSSLPIYCVGKSNSANDVMNTENDSNCKQNGRDGHAAIAIGNVNLPGFTTYKDARATKSDSLLLNPAKYIIKSTDTRKAAFAEGAIIEQGSHKALQELLNGSQMGNGAEINDKSLSGSIKEVRGSLQEMNQGNVSHMAGEQEATCLVYSSTECQVDLIAPTMINSPGINFDADDHLSYQSVTELSDDVTGTTFISEEHDRSTLSVDEYDINGTNSLSSIMEGTILSLDDCSTVLSEDQFDINELIDPNFMHAKQTSLISSDEKPINGHVTKPSNLMKMHKMSSSTGSVHSSIETNSNGSNETLQDTPFRVEENSTGGTTSSVEKRLTSAENGHATGQTFSLREAGATDLSDGELIGDEAEAKTLQIAYDEGYV